MKFTAANPKITASHLSRLAIIYVRQSSKRQVIEHTASAACQRSLTDLARHYGWSDELILVVDQDQGLSGTSTAGREGFKWLRQQIFEGLVGAIICWDASRIARDSAALGQLIKLCAATDTLIIDEKGVYDSNNDNDRTFLGLINVIVDDEGRRIADKAAAAIRLKAEAGEFRRVPPTGYVYKGKKLVFDPNKKVRDAFHLLFSTFEERGSILQTVKFFNRNGILFPTRKRGVETKKSLVWRKLTHDRASQVLHNPTFAGAYVFGCKKAVPVMLSADTIEHSKRHRKLSLDSGEVILIHNKHKGYITWEQFEKNQRRIKDNRYCFAAGSTGAERNGSALLQGIIECRECGRKVYTKTARRGVFFYACDEGRSLFGKNSCFYIRASRLDKAMSEALVEALGPAQMRMTLQALEKIDEEAKVADQRRIENIKRAYAEVSEARSRYESVDPRNRLVAEEYEKRLEEKLSIVKQLEAERAKTLKEPSPRMLKELRNRLSALAKDIRAAWKCNTVTHAERKKVLRCLISKVSVNKRRNDKCLDVVVHWATGAKTLLVLSDGRYQHPAAVELMRELAPDHTATQIIERLHQAGFKPVKAERFTVRLLRSCLGSYGINLACPDSGQKGDAPRGDGRFSTGVVARMLNVDIATVASWCRAGVLDNVQRAAGSPRWIKISPEQILSLKKAYPPKIRKALKLKAKEEAKSQRKSKSMNKHNT